ncbi:glycosyltransferase family 2 protein [Microbacterium sp. BK668]|uniref:glycosyltransferase family 2 protein n=1 Tax=Microbacterium sp. BK668 TaxID=2512118 RepID=UPI00106056FC|nr:glycosyltransferase family 2 protein [Microbacterium sp. BK668]TDN92462.1 glycosyltransferase involved in cell wall biosynthesis [Microbacterium sp. BK668]
MTFRSDRAAVTIIVPGYEVAAYADEALDSLRAQSRDDWAAILVDDASTDGTTDIFADAAAADPRFRLVRHEERRGLAAARNTGLDLVETPLVGFLDADDLYTATALERLVGTLDETGSDFAAGAYVRLRPDGERGYATGAVQPWVAAATDPERRATTIDRHPAASANIVAWSKVSRVEFWRRTGIRFPVGRLYEDQVVAQRMYAAARAFDVVPDVVVHWRERADGSSITQGRDALPVLREYLDGMWGGIAELDRAGHRAAVQERVHLILAMDLPPLVRIARDHPDDAYRRALGAFTRDLWARGVASVRLDDDAEHLAAAARLW